MVIKLKKSDDSALLIIPKVILNESGFAELSIIRMEAQYNQIVLSRLSVEEELAALLAASPQHCFAITDEDKVWLNHA